MGIDEVPVSTTAPSIYRVKSDPERVTATWYHWPSVGLHGVGQGMDAYASGTVFEAKTATGPFVPEHPLVGSAEALVLRDERVRELVVPGEVHPCIDRESPGSDQSGESGTVTVSFTPSNEKA